MACEKLKKQVDLEKLTKDDFVLGGRLRVVNKDYQRWRLRPEFRAEGKHAYAAFDSLFREDRFYKAYELIVQTPDSSEVVAWGYLHRSQRGDVSFGFGTGVEGQKRVYINTWPVWCYLLNDDDKPIVRGHVDLIFVNVSSRYDRDKERRRVLCD